MSEDACRICCKPFDSPKERVKDVVGFFYHRSCYDEKLEQQKRIAGGGTPKEATRPAPGIPAESQSDVKRSTSHDDRHPASDNEDDEGDNWDLTGDAESDWMHPDPDELEVNEKAGSGMPVATAPPSADQSAAKAADSPAIPTAAPQPRLSATAAATLGQAGHAKKAAASPAPGARPSPRAATPPSSGLATPPSSRRATPPTSRPAKPQPGPPDTPQPKRPKPQASESKSAAPPPKKASKPAPTSLKTGAGGPNRQQPVMPSQTIAGKKTAPAQPKPPQPAQPVGPRSAPAAISLPEGLEILPDEPGNLPDGLELLPDATQPGTLEGLEILDDAQAIPMAEIVELPAAAGRSPFGEPIAGGPFQSELLDPLMDGAPTPYRPRHSTNAIPTWLWALMGAGVAVAVIMLLASVVNVTWTTRKNEQPLARSESNEVNETAPVQGVPNSRENPAFENWRDRTLQINERHDSPTRNRQESSGTSDTASRARRTGFLVGMAVVLCIILALDTLLLRLACSTCGESDVSWGKSVLICILQQVVLFFLTLGSTSYVSLFTISIAGRICVGTALLRFLLPTPTGRALAIAVCHLVISVLIGMTLLILGIFLLTLASGSSR
ncbi:MAG: hypothetical protein ACYC6Y_00515 [Thermoguttaceae bacterium]